jgi:site-specific DNA recombinase
VAGAKVYGYDQVHVDAPSGKRLHTLRKINGDQAAVVRRVFHMYADGYGTTTVAHRLNADHVLSPRRKGWAQAGVKAMLRNEIYWGVVVWGRVQNVVRKGAKHHRGRPEAEEMRLAAPELQIITHELWGRVQARFAAQAPAARTTLGRA